MAFKVLSATKVVVHETPTPPVTATVAVDTFPQALPQPETETTALVNEFLVLYERYTEQHVKDLIKRLEEIKKTLQTYANTYLAADKPAIFQTEKGVVEFSERGEQTEIVDPVALVQHLQDKFGQDVAFSVVTIALTPLRKILSEHELKAFATKKPGSRSLLSVKPHGT